MGLLGEPKTMALRTGLAEHRGQLWDQQGRRGLRQSLWPGSRDGGLHKAGQSKGRAEM